VEFLEEANQFLNGLDEKARDKIFYNIWKARSTNDKELFKKLQDEIWKFRTKFSKTYYRLFAFWDKTDKYIGKKGTQKRNEFENELRLAFTPP